MTVVMFQSPHVPRAPERGRGPLLDGVGCVRVVRQRLADAILPRRLGHLALSLRDLDGV